MANGPRVLFVGGMDRNERALTEAGRTLGVDVEVHYGDVHGRGTASLEAMVARASFVVIVTGVNSHGGMTIAKRAARASNVPFVVMRNCGIAVAKTLLADIAGGRLAHVA